MKEKLIFDEWLKNRYEKIPDKKDKYVAKDGTEYKTDEVVNEYLEYFNTKIWGPDKVWKDEDMREDEIIKVVFSIDEEILTELDTGEAPHPMIVGNLLNHNICEFYNSTCIPTDGTSLHPVISLILVEWLNMYDDFIDWKDSSEKDFWECFI